MALAINKLCYTAFGGSSSIATTFQTRPLIERQIKMTTIEYYYSKDKASGCWQEIGLATVPATDVQEFISILKSRVVGGIEVITVY